MIINSNKKKLNSAKLVIADREDMTESRTSNEEFRNQFGIYCAGTTFKTNKKEKN